MNDFKFFLFIVFSFVPTIASAQEQKTEWMKQMNGNSNAEALSIVTDTFGNVYTTGFFQDTVDFDPGTGVANLTSNGCRNMFILKLDAKGNFIWVKKIGGDSFNNSNSIAIDKNSDIYLTGCFQGNAVFDQNEGKFKLTSNGGADIFILKLDATGNIKWLKQLGGAGDDFGFSVSLDGLDRLYIFGCFRETLDLNPDSGALVVTTKEDNELFILKLNNSGEFIWAKNLRMTTGDDQPSFITDVAGNTYLCGNIRGKVDFDPGKKTYYLKSKDHRAKFILKLNPLGNFLWVKKVKTDYYDYEPNIAVDINGNILMTSCFDQKVDFDPNKGKFFLTPTSDGVIFILKLNRLGDFQWVKSMEGNMGGSQPLAITTDSIGNIYTTGIFMETLDFDPGEGNFKLKSNGKSDIYISKIDSSGNFCWAQNIGGSLWDSGNAITADNSGNILVTGYIEQQNETKVVSDVPRRTHTIPKGDVFILKIRQTTLFCR